MKVSNHLYKYIEAAFKEWELSEDDIQQIAIIYRAATKLYVDRRKGNTDMSAEKKELFANTLKGAVGTVFTLASL